MNPHLLQSVKEHEGFRTEAYQDTEGVWTVGYGHNLESNDVPRKYCPFIYVSRSEGDKLLREDLAAARDDAERFPEFRMIPTIARRNVFIEMVFNLGASRLKGFKKMLRALHAGDYGKAADEMLDSKWATQVGRRALTLSTVMRQGFYS